MESILKGVRKIFKPDQIIYVRSKGTIRGLKMAMELKRNGYFPYKYHIEEDGKFYLVFYIIEEKGKFVKIPQKKAYFIPLNAFGIEEAGFVDIRAPMVSEKKKSFGNKVVAAASALARYDETFYDTEDDSDDYFYMNYNAYNGAIYDKKKLLFFNYHLGKRSVRLWKQDIPVVGD